MTVRILVGDCRELLRGLADGLAHTVVTSPPYWGLRDYGIAPSIWGGEQACDHKWGDPQRTAWANSVPGPSNTGKNGHEYRNETKWTGPFCERCGAWRGVFGLEPDWRMYVAHAVEIFREVHRVLRDDGTLWLNLGDCYATGAGLVGEHPGGGERGAKWAGRGENPRGATSIAGYRGDRKLGQNGKHEYSWSGGSNTVDPKSKAGIGPMTQPNRMPQPGLKPKDLAGIPWRVAFALQEDGWWLRQDIVWSKPNPMPESVTDRCTKAHEYLFLLSKSERYYFDQESILEPISPNTHLRVSQATLALQQGSDRAHAGSKPNGAMKAVVRDIGRGSNARPRKAVPNDAAGRIKNNESFDEALVAPGRSGNKERKPAKERGVPEGTGKNQAGSVPWEGYERNKRSVWTVTTQPFSQAHFATFPPALIEPCIMAGSPKNGLVLDPFGGAGTTGLVADRLERDALLVELNPDYADMARRRITQDGGMFTKVEVAPPAREAAE